MRLYVALMLAIGFAIAAVIPGCTTDQEASNVICQPSQLVRCNSCEQVGQCAGNVCRGWLQCSKDGTAFVGECTDCAPNDPSADSCASLQTCCSQSSLPTSEESTCSSVVTNNDEDDCYALLNQYLDAKSCGGVSNPVPPTPDGGVISAACTSLAPCCSSPMNSTQAAGACSALVSMGNANACQDAFQLYCGTPTRPDAGCTSSSCMTTDSGRPDATFDGPSMMDVQQDAGDADFSDSCPDGFICDFDSGDF
jgi:hypothetical protein